MSCRRMTKEKLTYMIATLVVALSSFLIILLVSAVMKKLLKIKYVQAALLGLKPCIIGSVMAAGVFMVITHCMRIPMNLQLTGRYCNNDMRLSSPCLKRHGELLMMSRFGDIKSIIIMMQNEMQR